MFAYQLRGFAVRSQLAVVRTLLDELDRTIPGSFARGELEDQLVEELTRLGCRALEVAAATKSRLHDEARA